MYPASILFTGAVSVVYALEQSKFVIPFLTQATTFLPGYGAGLGWIVPAFAGMAAGIIYSGTAGFPYEVEFGEGMVETDVAEISNVRIVRKEQNG